MSMKNVLYLSGKPRTCRDELERVKPEDLHSIHHLRLQQCELKEVPMSLLTFENLVTLNLRENQLMVIPGWISRLRCLEALSLGINLIEEVPSALSSMTRLRGLDLQLNELMAIAFASFPTSLVGLRLRQTEIKSLPESVMQLNHLTTLDLRQNMLPQGCNIEATTPEQVKALLLEMKAQGCLTGPVLSRLQLDNQRESYRETLSRLTDKERSTVVRIDMQYCALSEVPLEIKAFSNLKSLNLGHNELRSLPEWLSDLDQITGLSVSFNKITKIPPVLCELKKLRVLNLTNNTKLQTVPEYCFPESLSSLNLDNCDLSMLPNSMVTLTNLNILNLMDNSFPDYNILAEPRHNVITVLYALHKIGSITKPLVESERDAEGSSKTQLNLSGAPDSCVQRMRNLSFDLSVVCWLNLSSCKLTAVPFEVASFPNLRSLFLCANQLTSAPSWFSNIDALTHLELNSNRLEKVPPVIRLMTHLKVLNLDSNDLNVISRDSFPLSLQKLRVQNCGLYTLPASINSLTNLTYLGLGANPLPLDKLTVVSREGVVKLLDELSVAGGIKMTEIHLRDSPDTCAEAIAKIDAAEKLQIGVVNLGKCRLRNVLPSIPSFHSMRTLYLSENQLTTLPDSMSELKYLKVLGIDHNKMVTLPPVLRLLRRLRVADLSHNKWRFIPENGFPPTMESLSLAGCGLESLPASFKVMMKLEVLDLRGNSIGDKCDRIGRSREQVTGLLRDVDEVIAQRELEHLLSVGVTSPKDKNKKNRKKKKRKKPSNRALMEAKERERKEREKSTRKAERNHSLEVERQQRKAAKKLERQRQEETRTRELKQQKEKALRVWFDKQNFSEIVEVLKDEEVFTKEKLEQMQAPEFFVLGAKYPQHVAKLMLLFGAVQQGIQVTEDEDHHHIGLISYNECDILGTGSHGTVAFAGEFQPVEGKQSISVAIKRVASLFYSEKEIQILLNIQHENIVKYYHFERDKNFYYIVLERCEMTLHTKVTQKLFGGPEEERQSMLHLARALDYLHREKGILHRDLKPSNVLIDLDGKVKLCDMGLAKDETNATDTTATATHVGTRGWVPPEVFTQRYKYTKASDVYVYGLVCHFVFAGGVHCFGDDFHRISNMAKLLKPTFAQDTISLPSLHLVMLCVQQENASRPSMRQVVNHVSFWDSSRAIRFICAISDLLVSSREWESRFNHRFASFSKRDQGDGLFQAIVAQMESSSAWRDRRSFKDLLRLVRNVSNHQAAYVALVRESDEDLLAFFIARYPRLLVDLFDWALNNTDILTAVPALKQIMG